MTDATTRRYNDGEVFSCVLRRRQYTPEEIVWINEETCIPDMADADRTAAAAAKIAAK